MRVCERVNFVLDRCEDTAMVYMHLWPDVEVYLHDGVSDKKVSDDESSKCMFSKQIYPDEQQKKRRKKTRVKLIAYSNTASIITS